MVRYLAVALLALPSAAYGSQKTAQFTVGMTIVPSGAVQVTKARPGTRGSVVTGSGVPFREQTVQDGARQVRLIEF